METPNKKTYPQYWFAVGMSLVVTCFFNGCGPSGEGQTVDNKKLPKLFLHCPTEYSACIDRMRHLYNAIVSDGNLPTSKSIKVREVVHGTGASSHSHYYLANQKMDSHYHSEESTGETIHDLEIDVFTEFRDIAWTLPKVATNSDMKEDDWLAVQDASQGILLIVEPINKDHQTVEKRRFHFKQNMAELDRFLQRLENRVDENNAKPESTK